jgi:hypothetical protein
MKVQIKYLTIFVIPVCLFAVFTSSFAQHPDILVQALANQTNQDTLVYYVNVLSGEDSVIINGSRYLITSRNAFQPGNDLAADFIYQTLEKTGLPTYDQNYSASGRNVFAIQTGTDYSDQQFIICAHYDDMPTGAIAPGADDNASGTAAVLEAARILSRVQTPYTVIYALWDEEEIGLVGSGYYAQQAYLAGDDILGVVNLEMFGWDGNDDGKFEIHTRPVANSLNLANLIVELDNSYQISLTPLVRNPGTNASDHSSFWSQGYTAIVCSQAFFSGDGNPYYHTLNDRITHFNLGYFYSMSRLAVTTISHLALNNMAVGIDARDDLAVSGFRLEQNYPNPFNPTTTIPYKLPRSSRVNLIIYNNLGQEILTLVNGYQTAGEYQVVWDGRDNQGRPVPSGVYIYRLQGENFSDSRKMMLIR